eukprot:11182792-Karenia_brevis.AAC.1
MPAGPQDFPQQSRCLIGQVCNNLGKQATINLNSAFILEIPQVGVTTFSCHDPLEYTQCPLNPVLFG